MRQPGTSLWGPVPTQRMFRLPITSVRELDWGYISGACRRAVRYPPTWPAWSMAEFACKAVCSAGPSGAWNSASRSSPATSWLGTSRKTAAVASAAQRGYVLNTVCRGAVAPGGRYTPAAALQAACTCPVLQKAERVSCYLKRRLSPCPYRLAGQPPWGRPTDTDRHRVWFADQTTYAGGKRGWIRLDTADIEARFSAIAKNHLTTLMSVP